MKKITKLISTILLVIIMIMNIPNVSFGSSITVTNETELQRALEDQSVDTIILANDIYVSTALQLPYEGRNIAIQGSSSTIYGDGVQYLFVCSSDISTGVLAINFTDVIIEGNNKSGFLYMVSGTVSLTGLVCKSASNTNSGNGGAIYLEEGTVDLTNCTFNNCTASGNGGVVYNQGELIINDCNFTSNSAISGGAIYTNGTIKITGESNFQGNYANNGGAIYTTDLNKVLIDSGEQTTNFSGNQASYQTSIIFYPEYIGIHKRQVIGNYTTSVTPYLYNNYDINFELEPPYYMLQYDKDTTDSVQNMPDNENHVPDEEFRISPLIPLREGYVFVYWINSITGEIGRPGQSFLMPRNDVTLLADWDHVYYALKFEGNTQETVTNLPNDKYYFYQEEITIPNNIPERVGYRFVEWNTNAQGTGVVYKAGDTFVGTNSNQVLYAQWETNQVNTVYEANTTDPVENLPPTETHRFGEIATISNQVPVRIGYTFNGWNTNAQGTGTVYQPGESYMVSESGLTVYARWESNQYRLSYEPNTTSPVYNMPQDEYYSFGDMATVSSQIPQRVGHIFSGWNTNSEGTGTAYQPNDAFVMPSADVVLYAQWTPIIYRLTFNPNTSDPVVDLPDTIEYEFAEQITIPNQIPQREGYMFRSWNTRADGLGTAYNPGDMLIGLDSDEVLYAQWIQNPVTIVYDANTSEPVQDLPQTETHLPGESAVISSQIPIRSGYRFEGWNTIPDGTGIPYQPNQEYRVPQNGLTLYAQWKTKEEVLHFEPNAIDPVENLPEDITYIPGETVVISSEIPTRDPYVFTGWNTKPNGSGTEYQPGETFIGPEGGFILYAQWTVRQDVVNFNPNTTEQVQNLPQNFNYIPGETITIPEQKPTRKGYMFVSWNTEPAGKGIQYIPGQTLVGPEGGITLYAQWEQNQNPPIIIIIVITIIGMGTIICTIVMIYQQKCDRCCLVRKKSKM